MVETWDTVQNARLQSAYVSHHNAAVSNLLFKLRAMAAADAVALAPQTAAVTEADLNNLAFMSDILICERPPAALPAR